MELSVLRGLMQDPADFSDLTGWIRAGRLNPRDILAILGKTEGNGGQNDFTRELATLACGQALAETSSDADVMLSFSGGTEGVITPHYWVFSRHGSWPLNPGREKRLAAARGQTRPFAPHEVGTLAMVEETARVVRQLLEDARIHPQDVHFVHIKGALPSRDPGEYPRNTMAYARGASALGVAVALGEIAPEKIHEDAILRDWTLYSSRASTSAKPGVERSDILVLGNSPWWSGSLVSDHTVMRDMLDLESVKKALSRWGLTGCPLTPAEQERVVAVFAKAEADPQNSLRGFRHTMRTDDDISETRYARCVIGSVLAGFMQSPFIYVSTRAEHHGPPGGGPVALILTAPKAG